MISLFLAVERMVASIRRKLSNADGVVDRPPAGLERRTTHLPNGYVVSVEAPLRDDEYSRGLALDQHLRNVAANRKAFRSQVGAHLDGIGGGHALHRVSTRECPLLIEFLERRARR